jgi:hypothetical protein
MRMAFPDLHVRVDDMAIRGNVMYSRLVITGTHLGDFVGIRPTGAKIHLDAQMTGVFDHEGRGVEGWALTNYLGMIQELIHAMSWWQFLLNLPAIISQSSLGRDPNTEFGEAGPGPVRRALNAVTSKRE